MRNMDVSMQVAFSETFNIVTADAVMNDVPVVVSKEIKWVAPMFQTDPTDSKAIAYTIDTAIRHAGLFWKHYPSRDRLRTWDKKAIDNWAEAINDLS